MDSVYTSTITTAAKARGIGVSVIDKELPVFSLSFQGKEIRCYNGLTDKVGAATFHLAQDKGAANRFLRSNGFPVTNQELYANWKQAVSFMQAHESIVVKPVTQWGGRGVSTHISNSKDLKSAISFARRFCDEIVLEECVSGIDWRLIFVNYQYICAIQRNPACVTGNGVDTIRALITKKNSTTRKVDPSNLIPLDKETKRSIEAAGATFNTIPLIGQKIQVRRTSNYHTGGTVDIITGKVYQNLIETGKKVAESLAIPVIGIDMLVDPVAKKYVILELSPDLAISPPEGEIVAESFLDFLFPGSKHNENVDNTIIHEKQFAPIDV